MEEIKTIPNQDSYKVAEKIINILSSRKVDDLKLLYVENRTVLTDYFIICTGSSSTQIRSLAGDIEYKMSLDGIKEWNIDGYRDGSWIVVDYGCVMVHIFNHETRDFYKLRKLWYDAEEIDISDLLIANNK